MVLRNIHKSFKEIAMALSSNPVLVSLLYNDKPDALTNLAAPISSDALLTEHYIVPFPPVGDNQDINRNTYVSFVIDTLQYNTDDGNIIADLQLFVSTDNNHLILNDYRNRLLELVDQIGNTLDQLKLSASGKLNLVSTSYVPLSTFRPCYRMHFRFSDQQVRKAEI